jgi:hypothetical protein
VLTQPGWRALSGHSDASSQRQFRWLMLLPSVPPEPVIPLSRACPFRLPRPTPNSAYCHDEDGVRTIHDITAPPFTDTYPVSRPASLGC